MPSPRLEQLHGAMLEVELEILGSLRSVRGKGTYDHQNPDGGPALRILVNDPCGDFELILPESTWVGSLEVSDLPGCDYRISLARFTPC